MRFAKILFLVGGIVFFQEAAGQSQIIWQSSSGAPHLQSDGNQSLSGNFVFELGTFADSFVPTSSNTRDWVEHWVPLSRVDFNTTTQVFSGSAFLSSNEPPFTTSAPVFIWSRNRLAGEVEWSLVSRETWSWPDVNAGGIGPNPGGGGITFFTLDSTVGEDSVVGSTVGGGVQTESLQRDLPYELWALENFNLVQQNDVEAIARTVDQDSDGRVNLIEFVVGSDPNSSNDSGETTQSLEIEILDELVEIRVARFQEERLTFQLLTSEDLEGDFILLDSIAQISIDGESAFFRVMKDSTRAFFQVEVSVSE